MKPDSLFAISTLILSTLLLISGNAFLMTLLGVRMSLETFEPIWIGGVLMCYSIGFVLGTAHVGRVIARVGHIRTFAAFAALAASAALAYPLLVHVAWWASMRLIGGIAMAALLIVIESWFSNRATNQNRSTLFAIYLVIFYLATATGQILMNAGDPQSFKLFSLCALLMVLALIPLALTRLPAPSVEHAPSIPLLRLLREKPLAFTASLTSGVVISAFYSMGPVYANLIGLSLKQLSLFMSSTVLTAMMFAWPIGKICDHAERRAVLLWVTLLAALACGVVALVGTPNLILLLICVGIFMGFGASIYPIAVAILNDRIDSRDIVSASGGLLLAYGLGSCTGPLLGATMVAIMGPRGLFVGMAVSMLPLALLARYWLHHADSIPLDAQEHFVSTPPATTSVIVEIDPRNTAFHELETRAEGER
jgi:MFS family permease